MLRLAGVLGTLDVAQLMSAEEGGTSVAGVVPAGACIFVGPGAQQVLRSLGQGLMHQERSGVFVE